MSAPRTDYQNARHGVAMELIAASSALNMEPDPTGVASGPLRATDAWAAHADAHFDAAEILLLWVSETERATVGSPVWRAQQQLAAARLWLDATKPMPLTPVGDEPVRYLTVVDERAQRALNLATMTLMTLERGDR